MSRTEIVHQDGILRLGVSRNLVVSAWADAPGIDQLRVLGRTLHAVSGKHRGQHATVNLVHSGTPRFSDQIREELVKIIRDPRLTGKGGAHVVALSGLTGSTVRTFLSTILLVARPATPTKVFGDVAAAAAWLAPLASTDRDRWTSADIVAVAADVAGKAAG